METRDLLKEKRSKRESRNSEFYGRAVSDAGNNFPKTELRFLSPFQQKWINLRAGIHIFRLALQQYRSAAKSLHVLKSLYQLKKDVLGAYNTRIVKINGRYHHYLYAPAFPSTAFDNYIKGEFNRIIPIAGKTHRLNFCILAITQKCPLQCEHCFEWNNLNKKESFTSAELLGVLNKLQQEGLSQLHLSGGEPMVRLDALLALIRAGNRDNEYYLLTSGFNFTRENAIKLKKAGLTGVVISLDHFDEEKHNRFRGYGNSYRMVMEAVRYAQEQNLLVTLTLCATKAFISWDNLMQYAQMAKNMKVPFIQILEPKASGHYEGMDVCLDTGQLNLLEQFYHTINFDPAYRHYPIVIYHGYHLRRTGCFSGGNRMYYINSEGFVNACPFCNGKILNIKDHIYDSACIADRVLQTGCHQYKSAGI